MSTESFQPFTAKPVPALLKWTVLVLLVIGILFRFSHLDRKIYWHDEVFTSMEATAHTGSELKAEMFTGQERNPASLLSYQQIDPNRTLSQLIFGLGSEDPQHPPFFYLLMHFWMRLWGDSIVVTRSFAVLLSLLVFPAVYWLCWELFQSPLVGWVAIALLAISPIHLVYAQEAREYSLLTALTLLSSAALLRAMRLHQWQHWAVYGVTLTVSFYTAVFSALVAIGHGLYVICRQPLKIWRVEDGFQMQWQLTRRAIAFLITGAIAVVAFIPWLYFLVRYLSVLKASAGWVTVSLPIDMTVRMWLFNLTRVFFDMGARASASDLLLHGFAMVPILLLEIYALYFLVRHAPKPVWLFVVALCIGTSLPLVVPDILSGGQRSTVTRYLLPFFLSLQLAVAYLIAHLLTTTKRSYQAVGVVLSVGLAIAGIVSGGAHLQANTWWNKVMSYHHPEIAQLLNSSDSPLLITDSYGYNPANLVSLSYLLNETVTLLPFQEFGISKEIPAIADLSRPLFLLNLPDYFRDEFTAQYGGQFELVVGELWSWQPD
ncbi:glycosyltransferase family 39 protein [Oscillatoria sp. FACHB-1407]|uniref:glycosyltransferase family 39 protein n=1 Tax=Oscillatoria sp. FACHB-1407 TaxID=2692847 RepID=UPI001683FE9C|nr:glycosyltransferase family 39 protein [Oscillatoria sp. FACHB-1407]MBD2462348.1 glycosyltransferase family 39 protein [Oscillatoria sp. FACHB-1407]